MLTRTCGGKLRQYWKTGRRLQSTLAVLKPTLSELFSNPPQIDTQISTQGLIRSIREYKKISFVDISDGSGSQNLNVVISNPKLIKDLGLRLGQSISVDGKWTASKGQQEYEIYVACDIEGVQPVKVIGDVPADYPIQKKVQTLQFLRSLPTLRFKTSTLSSILRFRSFTETKLMEFFNSRHFVKTSPPLITSSDCEGAGELFTIETASKTAKDDPFFGKKSYLTVSTQLHLEAITMALNRAWTLTPCFRAEKSDTNRHLSEFWMLEAEMCYIDNVSQLTTICEEMIRYVTQSIKDTTQDGTMGGGADLIDSRFDKQEVQGMLQRWDNILTPTPWANITYKEAIIILGTQHDIKPFTMKPELGSSISTQQEKWLAGEHFKGPVFVTDYPKSQKPFYMKESSKDSDTVACFDLLMPEIGELIGGSVRVHDHKELMEELKRRNMNLEDMAWYINLRENGTVPHGGFGMGFERLLCYLANVENIRDVIPFPRAAGDCQC